MLAHIISILVLGLFAEEIYRTVRNFGVSRPGIAGTAAARPGGHVFLGLLFVAGSAAVLGADWAPVYAGPVAGVISLLYLGASLKYKWDGMKKGSEGDDG